MTGTHQQDEGLRDIVELFRKQCINKHGGIGFEETVYRLKAREECLVREALESSARHYLLRIDYIKNGDLTIDEVFKYTLKDLAALTKDNGGEG